MASNSRPSWDATFLAMCNLLAQRSKDQNTQVGAVLVGPDHEVRSVGYNCFPRGIDDDLPERQVRPYKYHFFSHAEENAICNAARVGIPCKGCTLYLPCIPCSTCARLIIQSGIREVICSVTQPWRDTPEINEMCDASLVMFNEAGVFIREGR